MLLRDFLTLEQKRLFLVMVQGQFLGVMDYLMGDMLTLLICMMKKSGSRVWPSLSSLLCFAHTSLGVKYSFMGVRVSRGVVVGRTCVV